MNRDWTALIIYTTSIVAMAVVAVFAIYMLNGCTKKPKVEETAKVKVLGIVDNGVLATHPLLNGRIVEYTDCSGAGLDNLSHGHGTAVAGRAAITNPELKIKFCRNGSGRSMKSRHSACCIKRLADSGVDALNLSFGSTQKSVLTAEAVHYAQSKGITVVASCGNRGDDYGEPDFNKLSYPGLLPGVVNVGALDNSVPPKRAKFTSNEKPCAEYRAGVRQRTSYYKGGYKRYSGTSFAAPNFAAELLSK